MATANKHIGDLSVSVQRRLRSRIAVLEKNAKEERKIIDAAYKQLKKWIIETRVMIRKQEGLKEKAAI